MNVVKRDWLKPNLEVVDESDIVVWVCVYVVAVVMSAVLRGVIRARGCLWLWGCSHEARFRGNVA